MNAQIRGDYQMRKEKREINKRDAITGPQGKIKHSRKASLEKGPLIPAGKGKGRTPDYYTLGGSRRLK